MQYYLQFFSKAREHVGDTLIDGSCLLEQQQAFRSHSKVQQAVQQCLLPDEPKVEGTDTVSCGAMYSQGKKHNLQITGNQFLTEVNNRGKRTVGKQAPSLRNVVRA